MDFVGQREVNGFILKRDFIFDKPLAVLTGKNGSGKTRFLESLKVGGGTGIFLNGQRFEGGVKYFAHQELMPKIRGGDYEEGESRRLRGMQEYFRDYKELFDCPEIDRENYFGLLQNSLHGISFVEVHKIIRDIAEVLGKKPSDLSDEEIAGFYDGSYTEMFGVKNLGAIFNRYKDRLNNNRYAQWKSEAQGGNVYFVKEGDIEKIFGREPWKILNEIFEITFHGKIKVVEPDLNASEECRVVFYIEGTRSVIDIADLSSGEKTLLWVALVLFYTQYTVVPTSLPPKLLILDEPDAFLHPSMVAQLMAFLDEFAQRFSAQVIITTHSPTTVALAPDGAIYLVENGVVGALEKDAAIACLLAGVSQISVNPFNRRQVFVESSYDADVYQAIYGALLHNNDFLDPKITLTFISSGPKMPSNQVEEKLRQVFGKALDEEKVAEFLKLVNGVGCCNQVEGVVSRLASDGSKTVRGLIDWDEKNKSGVGVIVLGEGKIYAIENIALDPVCIMMMMHVLDRKKYAIGSYCSRNVPYADWLQDQQLLQESIDWFINKVLKVESCRDCELLYVSGIRLMSDSRYLRSNGHELAAKVMREFDVLRSPVKGKCEKLNWYIVETSMITLTGGRFIPSLFAEVFSKLQAEAV